MDQLAHETERLFNLCDRENKGYLTVNDLKAACPQLDDEEIDFIFASLDADNSGKIERCEFLGGFQNALCRGESKDKINFTCTLLGKVPIYRILNSNPEQMFSGMKRRASVVEVESDCGLVSHQFDFSTVYEGTSETENSDSFSLSESLKGSTRGDTVVYNSDSDAYNKIDLTVPCQDELLFLYEQLQSSGMPEILHRFEKVVSNFCKTMKDQRDENARLQQVFESERQSYSRRMLEVENEIDQHISNAEKKARDEERKRLDQEKEDMRLRMEQEMVELRKNILSMQKMEDTIKNKGVKGEQAMELKAKLQDLSFENENLKSNLAEAHLEIAVIKSELLSVKSEYETRCEEMLSDNEAIMETTKESENLRRQLHLLYDANKKLHDTNDSLREALDQRTLAYKQLNVRTPSPLSFHREPIEHSMIEQKELSQASSYAPDDDTESGPSLTVCYDDYQSVGAEAESDKTLNTFQSIDEVNGPPERTFRIVMCGDASVGKSSIVMRITRGIFKGDLPSTLGIDFHVKNARIDEKNVAIQLWDTAGQERFRSLCKSYFRRADGAILVYDCTVEQTFLRVRGWIDTIKESTLKPIPILLCANKVDLRRDSDDMSRKGYVSTEDGRSLASTVGVLFAECSALDGWNVDEALLSLSRELMATEDVEVQSAGVILTQKKSSSSCC